MAGCCPPRGRPTLQIAAMTTKEKKQIQTSFSCSLNLNHHTIQSGRLSPRNRRLAPAFLLALVADQPGRTSAKLPWKVAPSRSIEATGNFTLCSHRLYL